MPRRKSNVQAQLSSLAITAAGGVAGSQAVNLLTAPGDDGKAMLNPWMANAAVAAGGAALMFMKTPALRSAGLGMASVGVSNMVESLITGGNGGNGGGNATNNPFRSDAYQKLAQARAQKMLNAPPNVKVKSPTNFASDMTPSGRKTVRSKQGAGIR